MQIYLQDTVNIENVLHRGAALEIQGRPVLKLVVV
jgi:hypothetical protein